MLRPTTTTAATTTDATTLRVLVSPVPADSRKAASLTCCPDVGSPTAHDRGLAATSVQAPLERARGSRLPVVPEARGLDGGDALSGDWRGHVPLQALHSK